MKPINEMTPEERRQLVEAADRLFSEIHLPTDEEELDAILREDGYDPDVFSEHMDAVAKRALDEVGKEVSDD